MMTVDTAPNRRRVVVVPWDLRTWEEIAKVAMVSVRSARRYSKTSPDPLPVTLYAGAARANSDEVLAWVRRRREEHYGEG